MEERAFDSIRQLPREELEAFAMRAALRIRQNRKEAESSRLFLAVLMGFLIGAIVASAGFVTGVTLG